MSRTVTTLSRDEARHLADRCAVLLRERFGVRRVVLFGSAVGDSPWHSRSDLDLAVEGLRPEDHLRALNACYQLLPPGLELDLIRLESAWPQLRARIEGEVEMSEEPLEALRLEIESEIRHLDHVAESLNRFLADTPAEPDELAIRGFASLLHDFYNGTERIFERIAVRLDGDLPPGPSWHTLLLQRMSQPFGSVRPAVIDRSLEVELSEYLRFRHTYGYDLEWERVRKLSQALSQVLETLKRQLAAFLATVGKASEGSLEESQ
ncbi:MAG: nucleotidyltransferase family protein [Anaerolineae bacterium]